MNAANSIITAPYPGLRPFKQEEADLFFGRESQINEMLTRLETQPDFRFLAVIGASGSGKSSLVRAGLLPALSQGFLLGVPAAWKFVTARPGNAPLRSLANAWIDTFHPQTDPPDAAELERCQFALAQLRAGPLGLVRAFRTEKETQGRAVLILIDQFEELFRFRRERDSAWRVQPVPVSSTTQSGQAEPPDDTGSTETSPMTDNAPTLEQQRNEAAAFVELLLATARQTEVPMYVVITMRSDFLGDCDVFLNLPEAISRNQYLTPRMTRSQLSEAITRPLELPQFGASIEPALVNQMLNDVGTDPDQLPLMQHALLRTWQAAVARSQDEGASPVQLSSSDYGTSGGVKQALSQDADEALEELRKMERGESLVRMAEMLFRSLAHKSEIGQLVRRPIQFSEVLGVVSNEPTPQDYEDLIQVLATFEGSGRHFLMRTSADRQSAGGRPFLPVELNMPNSHLTDFIDISHESLLRQWDQVQRWFVREADAARQYRRLVDAVQAGENRLTENALDQALVWRRTPRTPTWAMRYDNAQTPKESLLPKCLELIEESKKARDSDAAEVEFVHKRRFFRIVIAGLVLVLLFIGPLGLLHKPDPFRLATKQYSIENPFIESLQDGSIFVMKLQPETIENIRKFPAITTLGSTSQKTIIPAITTLGSTNQKAMESFLSSLERSQAVKKASGNEYEEKYLKVALEINTVVLLEGDPQGNLKGKAYESSQSKPELPKNTWEHFSQKTNNELKTYIDLSDKESIDSSKPPTQKHILALPPIVNVISPSNDQPPLIQAALSAPLLPDLFPKHPELATRILDVARFLAHLLVFFALVFVVETVYRRFAVRINYHMERFQSRRSKVIFSVVLLLFGLVLLSVGLFCFIKGVEAKSSMFILGVPVGVILILLVPTDALLKRLWAPRFKEVQGFLLQLCGFYALAGSGYLFMLSSPVEYRWEVALLLVRNPWALAIAGIGLVILGKRKCALTTEETLVCEPEWASGPVNSQTRLYSDRAIGLAAFCPFGWGLPAGVMMFRNLWGIGRRRVASIAFVAPFVGIVGTFGFGTLIFFYYNDAFDLEITALLVMVFLGSPFATYWLWRRLSGREIRQHVAFGGALQPSWKALLVLLIAGCLGWISMGGVTVKLVNFIDEAHAAANKKVAEGQALAQRGDEVRASAALQAAQQLYPDIDLDPATEAKQTDPQAVAQQLVIRAKAKEKLDLGRQLARKGDVDGATVALQAAQQLDPNIDLDPATEAKETDPQAVAQQLETRAKTEEKLDLGRQLARKGDVDGAIVALQAAQQRDPNIDLDPATETRETDPQVVAKQWAAIGKIDEGQALAQKGDIEKALQAYTEAEKLAPSLTDARFWNNFAWNASSGGHAVMGLEASEKAVTLLGKDDYLLAEYRDTRGLARALTGDTPGAIEDFQAFIDSGHRPELKAQRQQWVDALRKGQQPFTPQLLEKLRSQ
jgi:tetratricopeptide (TPR) repeat protein